MRVKVARKGVSGGICPPVIRGVVGVEFTTGLPDKVPEPAIGDGHPGGTLKLTATRSE
jgi:hypothetical protein